MNKYQRRQIGIKKARRVLRVLRSVHHSEFYANGGEYEKRLIKTRVPCSCPMCGNPRRHFGQKTLQEKKSAQQMYALDAAMPPSANPDSGLESIPAVESDTQPRK